MPKLPKLTKRLQVTARTLSETGSPDFAPAQPTARLGSAFILAFSCHILLIAGLFSFHKIRAGRPSAEKVAVKAEKQAELKQGDKAAVPAGGDPSKTTGTSSGDATAAAARAALAAGGGAVAGGAAATASGASTSKSVATTTAAGEKPDAAKVSSANTSIKASSKAYDVKPGDNPVRIAKTLGVKLEDLLALNGIDDPKKLKPGQTLKVPESIKTESSAPTVAKSASTASAKPKVSGSKSSTTSSKASVTAAKGGTQKGATTKKK